MSELFIVLAIVFTLLLWWMYRQHNQQVLQARAELFKHCETLISESQTRFDNAGYASLTGSFKHSKVSLAVDIDNLTMRKLPVMWLHINIIRQKTTDKATLDILVRPQNMEFYSPSWQWSQSIKPLSGWPLHARYMSKNIAPDLQHIDEDVKSLFVDEKVKELLITPDKLRLTYLIRQAERGHYLLLRTAHFDPLPVAADLVIAMIERLQLLEQHLQLGADQ